MSMSQNDQQIVRSIPGNDRCVDCSCLFPQWASVSFGVLMCLECSGRHRGLGVHISFVRSITMDAWTPQQVYLMQKGGNTQFLRFLSEYKIPLDTPIMAKYNTSEASYYREWLSAICENREPPVRPRVRSPEEIVRDIQSFEDAQERMYRERMQQLGMGMGNRPVRSEGNDGSSMGDDPLGLKSVMTGAIGIIGTGVQTAASATSRIASSTVATLQTQEVGGKIQSRVHEGWSAIQTTLSDPDLSNKIRDNAKYGLDKVSSTTYTGWSVLSSGVSSFLSKATVSTTNFVSTMISDENGMDTQNNQMSSEQNNNFNVKSTKEHQGENWDWNDETPSQQSNTKTIEQSEEINNNNDNNNESFSSLSQNTTLPSSNYSPYKTSKIGAKKLGIDSNNNSNETSDDFFANDF